MKQVLIKDGGVILEDVPAPLVSEKTVLVRSSFSCVSAGTEMVSVTNSGLPLYQRALKQPENVKKALEALKNEGISRTYKKISGKLNAGTPTGYSLCGEVVEIGKEVEGFSIGDYVACAGAGIANHAEFSVVPVNLCVKVPPGVALSNASTVTLGAIAMQGLRRANPQIGETAIVFGLGILGQLTCQMLNANGVTVIGVDIDEKRIATARQLGVENVCNSRESDPVSKTLQITEGIGADFSIITASSSEHGIISTAAQCCRKKGRVILVGDVGLKLKREDFYIKELDLNISCSYGPGRYDPFYENEGQDYPIGYVRWTENRNMAAYLDLIAKGRLNLDPLVSNIYPVEEASAAYEQIKDSNQNTLIVLLRYRAAAHTPENPILVNDIKRRSEELIRVGIVGASGFVESVHIPNILAFRKMFSIRAVGNRTGSTAKAIAKRVEAEYCTSDFNTIIEDEDNDLIVIGTRHNVHAGQALACIRNNKSVLLEKPLALTREDVDAIKLALSSETYDGHFMVGYNRRFSPAVLHMKKLLENRQTPIVANYRMNAGYIAPDSWVQGEEGGGRNLGEACHIYDLFNFLCDSTDVTDVKALSINPPNDTYRRDDNFCATVSYADGSICTLTYTALGTKRAPKECLSVFCDGKVIEMNDYREVSCIDQNGTKSWKLPVIDKGHKKEMEELGKSLLGHKPPLMSHKESISPAETALIVQEQIKRTKV